MMWIMFRLPWIYGAIFGFQRLTRWPKCTPASTSSLTSSVCDFAMISNLQNNGFQGPPARIRPTAKASGGPWGLGSMEGAHGARLHEDVKQRTASDAFFQRSEGSPRAALGWPSWIMYCKSATIGKRPVP